MRKIPRELKSPIENTFCDIAEVVFPYMNKIGFTPNGVTTLSLIFGLFAVKFYIDGKYLLSAITYVISYMFDCWDGAYARKYNMVSKFGDYYDHIKDILVQLLLGFFILKKYNSNPKVRNIFIIIEVILIIMDMMFLGCRDVYYSKISKKEGSETLNTLQKLCPADGNNKEKLVNVMKILRYFEPSTKILFTSFVILYSSQIS